MRQAMDNENKDQKSNNQMEYKNQNNLLRELHLERMKRMQEKFKDNDDVMFGQQLQQIQQIREKQEKLQYLQSDKNNNLENQILLNRLVYDKRDIKPKFTINFFTLFQDQPIGKAPPNISEHIQAVLITTFGFQLETFEFLIQNNIKCYIVNDSNLKETAIHKNYGECKYLTVIERARKVTGYGVSHTKMWLIKFKKFLRVVVCSSNQHIMDWTLWQNSFWFQDFPLIQKNEQKLSEHHSDQKEFNYEKDFKNTLQEVLDNLLPDKKYLSCQIGIDLSHYKFAKAAAILIPSFQGRFTDKRLHQIGMNKIGRIIKKFGRKMKKPIMTYASTSLGTIDSKFISQLYQSFCPGSIFNVEKFRLVYPTQRYVMQETCQQAQILFLLKKNYQKSDLKDKIFYKFDTNPQNPILGCLSHLKIIFIQSQDEEENGILYIGSHNATRAAWGKLQKNHSQIFCSNQELGLLFLNYSVKKFKQWSPFRYPPQKYGNNDKPFIRD